jgi:hypothetical protein
MKRRGKVPIRIGDSVVEIYPVFTLQTFGSVMPLDAAP